MKRVFAMILSALMLLSLLPAVTLGAQEEAALTGVLYAGYNKVRVDPSGHPDGNITGLPMSGYGDSTARLSTGTMDDTGDKMVTSADGLYATCIAMTDQYDNTLLYFGVDFINAARSWANPAKRAIVAALAETGHTLDVNDIYISASHTHNGPDLSYGISYTEAQLAENETARKMKTYRDWVYEMLCQAAVAAMEDREEVTLTKGVMDVSDAIKAMDPDATENQQRMNYVRHYESTKNGETVYGGSNFGYVNTTSASTTMVSDPVDLMYLVQLTPKSGDKDPIVLVNWNAHVTINSTTGTAYGRTNHYKMSSDYVNCLRIGLAEKGYRAAFSQGAAGNTTPSTTVKALQNPDVLIQGENRGYSYGKRLSEITLYGLENCMGDPLDTSFIRTASAQFTFETNAPTQEEAALVTAMLEADPTTYPSDEYSDLIAYLTYSATNWSKRSTYYSTFPYLENINSRYQLSSAKSRMQYLTTEESSITVGVIAIGKNLSFVVSPNELADRYSATDTLASVTDNDWLDLMNDTYGMPLVMGYTNDSSGYIPNQLAYTYNEGSTDYAVGSYESQVARYARGTGEKLIPFYAEMLESINTDAAKVQCECGGTLAGGKNGHVCKLVEFLPWSDADSLPVGGNYYLTTDVVLTKQTDISNKLHLDLNGHNITHKVTAAAGEAAAAGQTHNTRVFSIIANGLLTLTDSTDAPGTVSRDLSNLTDTQKEKITNYGLLILINENAGAVLYNGILDATGTYSGGGGCISVHNATSNFKMYGGTLRGGIANSGGVMFNRGHAEFYGGLVTGGVTKSSGGYCGGIYTGVVDGVPGRLTIGGTVRIENNKRSNGRDANIYMRSSVPAENLTVKANFTGKASIYVESRSAGKIIGICENPNITANNLTLDHFTDYGVGVQDGKLVLVGERSLCECGGVLTGKTAEGHTCQDITWKPWPSTTALPSAGNYYLMGDVTIAQQKSVSDELRIDLNGFDITHRVAADAVNTRVFDLSGGSLVITDSTDAPGCVKRDLSDLSEAKKDAITNYGLLVLVSNVADTGDFTLYNGTLDAQGAYTCGGAVANLNTAGAAVKLYGGTVTGAVSRAYNGDGGYGGGIYAKGAVQLHGGTVTGNTAGSGGGVFLSGAASSLVLTGSPNISGNVSADGTVSNIATYQSAGITVKGAFTGTAGFTVAAPANGAKVATGADADITGAALSVDGWPVYAIVLSGSDLVMQEKNTAAVISDSVEKGYETLAQAIAAYPGGDAVLMLLRSNAEAVTFPANANLDLAGCDLSGNVTLSGTLFVKDSATDDYTVEDAQGYGTVPAALTGVEPMAGYLMATEAGGCSFHCLNLDTVAVTLRPCEAGIYFQSQFGGDEFIKSMVKTYGVALGAGRRPNYAEGTYTAFDGSTWAVGADSDGNANNLKQGTLLKDILKPTNDVDENSANAASKIYGRAYVELTDGTRYVGNMVCLTLQSVLEGNSETGGVDRIWDQLSDVQKAGLTDMYRTYEPVMTGWNIPNIKAACQED